MMDDDDDCDVFLVLVPVSCLFSCFLFLLLFVQYVVCDAKAKYPKAKYDRRSIVA